MDEKPQKIAMLRRIATGLLMMIFLVAGCDRSEKPDFTYKVLSKSYTPGALVNAGGYDRFGHPVKTRIDARHEVVFKGVESGREYPPMLVKESSYRGFVEGGVYDRAALNAARK